jgi:hypothetical protein
MAMSRSALPHRRRRFRALAVLALASAGGVHLSACSTVGSDLPAQVGGLPQGTPERPATTLPYPAVQDMPPPRTAAVLTEEEKKKVEAELAAMREEQARRAARNPAE